MTTLTNHPVSTLLERLFADADSAPSPALAAVAGLSQQERERLMRSKEAYRVITHLCLPAQLAFEIRLETLELQT